MRGARTWRRGAAVAAIAAGCVLAAARGASADTFLVTQHGDPDPGACDADCSLREAVLTANDRAGVDTVSLPRRGGYALQIRSNGDDAGLGGDLDVKSDMTIEYRGRRGGATITSRGDRAIDVEDARLRLVNVGASWTRAPAGDGNGNGGAIYAGRGADVFMRRGLLYATRAPEGHGGGIYAATGSRVTLVNLSIAGGSLHGGGAIAAAPGSTVSVRRGFFVKGSGRMGGSVLAEGDVTIDSTAIGGGGAIAGGSRRRTVEGGAIFVGTGGSLALTNSTLYFNAAVADGGAIYAAPGSTAAINASTITRNFAAHTRGKPAGVGTGGGIYAADRASILVANTIVARNQAAGAAVDCDAAAGGIVTSGGANLLSTLAGGCGFARPGDLVSDNPGLKNGNGPGGTIPLLAGSPAVDAAGPTAPGRDQRGRSRDERPDIGAYELGAGRLDTSSFPDSSTK